MVFNSGELRQQKLQLRDKLEESKRKEYSKEIVNTLLEMEEIKKGYSFFVYVSFRSEVETRALVDKLIKEKKRVSVPITHVQERYMEAVHIEDFDTNLTPGYCGIMEPTEKRQEKNTVAPETIDIVIVPGSVFDKRGGRFGYGGGYYDKFLNQTPLATRIGLGFDVQVVDEAPLQPHDELLDYIITEKNIIIGRS